jgi:hypothetical protein
MPIGLSKIPLANERKSSQLKRDRLRRTRTLIAFIPSCQAMPADHVTGTLGSCARKANRKGHHIWRKGG